MSLVSFFMPIMLGAMGSEHATMLFGSAARNGGITTCSDLGSMALMDPKALGTWKRVTGRPGLPHACRGLQLPGRGRHDRRLAGAAQAAA